MKTNDFWYQLPEELIAQHPLLQRDASRMMVCNSDRDGYHFETFSHFVDYLNPGDVLVINDSRVMPARLLGVKVSTGVPVEVLLLKRHSQADWECLVKPGRRLPIGTVVSFGDGLLTGTVTGDAPGGCRMVRFDYEGVFEALLDRLGQMPLPPYIHEQLQDRERYQTVYSKQVGSAAAPTAGLHFTPRVLEDIRAKGVAIAPLTLHVGLGTFRPVKAERIEDHPMHSESYILPEESARLINQAKESGGRVVAVGTTSVRVLESVADESGRVQAAAGDTQIFIFPGYRFKVVDMLLTNFHLPESTLIMLVSALMGRERTLDAYRAAVEAKCRFFSFGDCMLIGKGLVP